MRIALTYPFQLKISQIVMIKNKTGKMCSYRPIASLPIITELYEKLLLNRFNNETIILYRIINTDLDINILRFNRYMFSTENRKRK